MYEYRPQVGFGPWFRRRKRDPEPYYPGGDFRDDVLALQLELTNSLRGYISYENLPPRLKHQFDDLRELMAMVLVQEEVTHSDWADIYNRFNQEWIPALNRLIRLIRLSQRGPGESNF